MKKGKTFDYYLQEALKELEKPCEEFNATRCEKLLTKCCRVLLESVNENSNCNGKDKKGKRTNEECQRVEKKLRSFLRPIYSRNNQTGLWRISRNVNVNETVAIHSFVGCPAFSIGSAGSNGSFRTDGGSSPLDSRRLVPDKADKSITLGRFHSNPPKGELNKEQDEPKGNQRLFTVAVEIDSLSGETVQVKADSPEKALAEALQKLTPGVKTSVLGEE